jgi:hypothetical protein
MRKRVAASGGAEGQGREMPGQLMMAVTVGVGAGKAGDDNQRTERADDADHVVEHILLGPARCRLGARLRESEINRAREELVAAIEPARLQQLLGANDAKRIEQLAADDVLTALATGQRQIGDARVVAACRPRQER